MKAGDAIDFESFPAITREQLRAYAEASGDPNPIHLDDAVARKAGLPGIIAHGMLIAAFVAERARRVAGPEWRMAKLQTRFKGMTALGDVISVGGVVKNASSNSVELELEAKDQAGAVKVSAVASFAR